MKRRHRLAACALILVAVVLPGPWGGENLPAPGTTAPTSVGDPVRGARLFRKLDCLRCHTEPRSGQGIDIPPSLRFAGSRARASWMATWLRDPEPLRFATEGVRPRIRMPAASVSLEEAQDLASYLSTARDSVLFEEVPDSLSWMDSARVAQGKALFQQYQCQGCHQLGGEGRQIGPALDGVGLRRRPRYVMALLKKPNAVIPGTAMKDFDLWPEEIRALTSFLMSLKAPSPSE